MMRPVAAAAVVVFRAGATLAPLAILIVRVGGDLVTLDLDDDDDEDDGDNAGGEDCERCCCFCFCQRFCGRFNAMRF